MWKLVSICITLVAYTFRNLVASTHRHLGALNALFALFQAELQCLVTPQFPGSSRRIPPPARPFHLTLRGHFLNIDTDSDYLCALACLAFWTPQRLLYDQLDGFEPPLAGCVVAVAYTQA